MLRDATSGAALAGACVLWTSVDGTPPPQYNRTNVDYDGTWSLQPDQPGPFNLAFYTADNYDCSGQIRTTPVPSWFENTALTGSDPNALTPPAGVDAVSAGTTDVVACLGATALPTAACAVPTTVLSGRVTTTGPTPLAEACIFILTSEGAIAQAITDADGAWTVENLPVDIPVVVGVVAPFQGDNGPCSSNGPPPVAEPGELQDEMFDNIEVDLSDPDLLNDPFTWGTRRGAVAITNSASGLDVCLTTDPANVVPRPACEVPTSSPTPTPTPTVTTTATAPVVVVTASPSTPTEAELAATGGPLLGYAAAGMGLLASGLLILLLLRVRKPAPRSH